MPDNLVCPPVIKSAYTWLREGSLDSRGTGAVDEILDQQCQLSWQTEAVLSSCGIGLELG